MTSANPNARVETLCDGVFAIALTLLILDVKLTSTESITTTAELWRALRMLAPTMFAFVLSFGVIFTTWVNHHASLKLVHTTSAAFIYANGFLLLTVVSLPFPTSLLGDFLWTDHAAPAVALYNAVLAAQALGWILVGGAVLKDHLTSDERSTVAMRDGRRNGYAAFALYTLLAVAALWFPRASALVTTGCWIFWLVQGARMKHV